MPIVTDPDILAQLNAPQPVSDPAVLAQLNQPQAAPTFMQKLGQTWPAQLAKDVWSGITLPGDVYQGNTQVNPSDPEFMKRVTSLGAVTPVGTLPSAAASAPSAKQLIQHGGNQLQQVENSDLVFTPGGTLSGIQTIRQNIPRPERAPDTHEVINNLAKKAEFGSNISIKDILNTRNELRDVQSDAGKGRLRTSESELNAATTAKHLLDDFGNAPAETVVSGNPSEVARLLQEGNQNVSAGKLAEGLNKKLFISEVKAASANSGQNLENTIRRKVGDMALSREGRMMPPDVRDMAFNVAFGSGPENFMRKWGNRLGGGQGLGWAATTGIGAGLGYLGSGGSPTVAGMAAVGAPIIGGLLKRGATEAAVSHLAALSNALRANTPLGPTMNRANALAGIPEGSAQAHAALIRALTQPYSPAYNYGPPQQ